MVRLGGPGTILSSPALILAALLLLCGTSLAQQPIDVPAVEQEQSQRLQSLQRLSETIDSADATAASLVATREALRDLRLHSQGLIVRLGKERDAAKVELDRLGPAPAEGEPAETEAVSDARQTMMERHLLLSRLVSQSEFTASQARLALDRIAKARQALFLTNVLAQGPPLYDPRTWQIAAGTIGPSVGRAGETLAAWWVGRTASGLGPTTMIFFVLAGFAAFALLLPLRRRFEPAAAPDGLDSGFVARRSLVRAVCSVGAVAAVFAAAMQTKLPYLSLPAVATQALVATALVAFVTSAVSAISALPATGPTETKPGDTAHRSVRIALCSAAIVLACKIVLLEIVLAATSSLELTSLIAALFSGAAAIVLLPIASKSSWALMFGPTDGRDGGLSTTVAARARIPFLGLLIAVLAFSAIGMAPLAQILISTLVQIGALVWFLCLSRLWIRAVMDRSALIRKAGALLHVSAVESEEAPDFKLFWWGVALDVALVTVGLPVIFLILGVELLDLTDLALRAIYGFTIGGITISLVEIASAAVAFFAIVFATRMIQRTLDRKVLPRTRLDPGIRNSLVTLTGYVGLVVAFALGISIVGFDLSSLTIIAGALSIGIGFGLQSIVNNFVSGLILLFERPIKAGDWIVTASGEGTVKRISVRSTEIETFNRCSIIVPNSELIASTVQNWTHKDKIGRVIVPISVSYDSDPRQVRDILLSCAEANAYSLKDPPPYVYWKEFGASSLDFEVRMFIRDISNITLARNDLRFEIFDALKQSGIEIPYAQTDVHFRDLDRIEEMAEAFGGKTSRRARSDRRRKIDPPT